MRVGIVGFGFMGRMHYRCWSDIEDAEVAAICELNPAVTRQAKEGIGNIEGAAKEVDPDKVRVYQDYDRMLCEAQLDAVSVTLPSYLHAEYSIKALRGGVHVLCEKPMALTVGDCEKMIKEAEACGKVLQIGHCVRFWPEYACAKQIGQSGEYGELIAASLRRLTSAPAWSWNNWALESDKSGGMVLDLHIHDTDYVQFLLGMPRAVRSFGVVTDNGQISYIHTHYLYSGDKSVTAEGSWLMKPAFGFEMSFNIMLERASIVYDCTRRPGFRLCPADGESFTPEVAGGDGYSRQIEHFAKRLRGGEIKTVTTPEDSGNSVRIAQAERQSVLQDREVVLK